MYHEVGRFYSYTEEDGKLLQAAIEGVGYELCYQPDGDVSIMSIVDESEEHNDVDNIIDFGDF